MNLKSNVSPSDAFMWEYFTSKKYYDTKEIKQIDQIYTPWSSWVVACSSDAMKKPLKDFIGAVGEGIDYFNNNLNEGIKYIYETLDYSEEDATEWTKTVKFNSDIGKTPLDWENIVVNTTNILKMAGVLTDSDETISSRLLSNVKKTNL